MSKKAVNSKTKAKKRLTVPHHRRRQSSQSQQPDLLANWQGSPCPTKQQPPLTKMLNRQIPRHLPPFPLRCQRFKKLRGVILQTLRSTAPTLAMSMAITARAATLRAPNNALTTEDAVPGNQGKPLVPRVIKRAQTIGLQLSQCPTTMTTSATHGLTAQKKLIAKCKTPLLPTTDDNPLDIAPQASPLASMQPQNLKKSNKA